MSLVSRNGTSAYIGLPEREASKLEDLWRRDEVGVELSVEVNAPVVIGVYPMRLARFVIDQQVGNGNGIGNANGNGNGNGNGFAPHPTVAESPNGELPDR